MRLYFFWGLLMLSASANASYEVIICNQCSTEQDLKSVAISAEQEGVFVVANLESRTIKTFNVINEPFLGGFQALPRANPLEIEQNKQSTFDFYDAVQSTISYLESPSLESNGCGGEGSSFNILIPQQPFLNACTAHDLCYQDGRPLSVCNTEFLGNMQQIVSKNTQNLIDEGAFALDVALSSLLQGQLAKAFKAFVDWKGANYYCQDGLNSDRPECIILNPTNDFSGEILVFEPQGYSEQSIGIEGFGMNIVCDQITYRITTTDENGSNIGALQVIENCKLVELY